MFARRKPKMQKDEPLVPHGLVWQATAEPEAAPEGNMPVVSQENSQGKPVEMPQPPAPANSEAKADPSPLFPLGKSLHNKKMIPAASPAEPPSEAPVPRKPVAASPPEFWKSVKRPELVKTSAPETSVPSVSHSEPAEKREVARRPEPQLKPALVAIRGKVTEARVQFSDGWVVAARLRAKLSSQVQAAARAAGHLPGIAGSKLGESYRTLRFEQKISGVRSWAARSSQNVSTQARPYRQQFHARIASWSHQAMASAKTKSRRAYSTARQQIAGIANRARNSQLKIRVTGLPLRTRISIARSRARWAQRTALRGDSRLWISMAMGGLSALLALGLITTVRHYGTAALPSHALDSTSATKGSKASGVVSQAGTAMTPPVVHADAPARASTSEPMILKPARVSAPVKRTTLPVSKHRRSQDEDYVARDTYVVYGAKPNKSR